MAKFGLSQSIRRVEDPRLLKGGGRFVAAAVHRVRPTKDEIAVGHRLELNGNRRELMCLKRLSLPVQVKLGQ